MLWGSGMSGNGKRSLRPVGPKESLADKMAKFQRNKESLGVNWSRVNPALLKACVLAATDNGAAVMFSTASGGRGVCLTLFDNGDKVKLYAIDQEELEEHMNTIVELFTDGSQDYLQAVV